VGLQRCSGGGGFPFVRNSEPDWYRLLSFIHTRWSSAIYIADLLSLALKCFFATHCCPTVVLASCMLSTSLTCICVLQNLIGTYCRPTFICAARMPSTLLTCIRTCCRVSLVPTAVLHSHLLGLCCPHHWLHSYALLVCLQHR